jgi:hypothetical protein
MKSIYVTPSSYAKLNGVFFLSVICPYFCTASFTLAAAGSASSIHVDKKSRRSGFSRSAREPAVWHTCPGGDSVKMLVVAA